MLQVVILAGGFATRLRPKTEKIPKAMLDIAGKPFIARQLLLLKNKGVKEVVICCGYLGNQIENFVKDGSDFGLKVVYSYDGDTLLGTGGAIKKALPLLHNNFMIIYGDSYLDVDYQDISKIFLKSNKSFLMTIYKNNGKYDKSNIVYKNGIIENYNKNEMSSEMQYIDYGISCFKKDVFLREPNNIFDLSYIFEQQIYGKDVVVYEVTERFYEIGSLKGLGELNEKFGKK